jgi:hypothetical protein
MKARKWPACHPDSVKSKRRQRGSLRETSCAEKKDNGGRMHASDRQVAGSLRISGGA